MQVEERFGLKKRHSYDEIVAYLRSDPKGMEYPNRFSTQLQNSHVYGQLKDSLRTFTEGQDAYAAQLRRGGEDGNVGPFVPPRPRFRPPNAADVPIPPDDDDDDDLMGPPGPGPDRFATLLEPAPNASDQILLAEGMQPPPPPPPPAPSMMQQAGQAFAQAAGDAAGGVLGAAATSAASGLLSRAMAAAGIGAAAGAEAGPPGALAGAAIGAMGSVIEDAVGAVVRRGFEPGGGSSQQPSGPPVSFGPGGLQQRIQPNRQEAVNRQQRLHNQGTGAPAAQVDYRSLNGLNHAKPVDRKVRLAGQNGPGSTRLGILGGSSSGSGDAMTIAGSGSTRPGTPMDPGGTKIPRKADPAPMQAPSYKDLVGKLKQQKAPEIGPISTSGPRERSPPRGDRRPLEIQRGPLGMRDAALSTRNKTIPKGRPPPEFNISDKRKAETDIYDRKKPPNPASNKFPSRKQKAEGPPSDEYQQDLRKAPPKPEGRLAGSRNRIRPAPKPKPEPKPKPDASRNKRNKKK